MTSNGTNLPIQITYKDALQQQNSVLIDCRTVEEFESGHLEDAINVPLQHLAICIDDLPCNCEDTIYVYCKSGNRSGTFALYLRSLGYTKCQSIEGGFEEWGEPEQC